MTGPSATGSLKGTPTSIMSAPASANSRSNSSVTDKSGSPAVMKGMKPPRLFDFSFAKTSETRLIERNELQFSMLARLQIGHQLHVFIATPPQIAYEDPK